jgi:hypothetical protein
MRLPVRMRNTGFHNRERLGLALYAFLILLGIACNKKVVPPPVPDKVVEYIVQDCTIVIPADTTALFLKWSELCDTNTRYISVPFYKTIKKNRLSIVATSDSTGVTFVCKEDSLLKVIEMIKQTTKESLAPVQSSKTGGWITDYSILFLALACAVFGIVMLFRR